MIHGLDTTQNSNSSNRLVDWEIRDGGSKEETHLAPAILRSFNDLFGDGENSHDPNSKVIHPWLVTSKYGIKKSRRLASPGITCLFLFP